MAAIERKTAYYASNLNTVATKWWFLLTRSKIFRINEAAGFSGTGTEAFFAALSEKMDSSELKVELHPDVWRLPPVMFRTNEAAICSDKLKHIDKDYSGQNGNCAV